MEKFLTQASSDAFFFALMKRILLISDTHGYLDPKVKNYGRDCDEIWHAGDIGTMEVAEQLSQIKPLRAVFGNIDDASIRQYFPEELAFTIEGLPVFMTHIGGYPGRYSPEICKKLLDIQPGLFICGHSHILKVIPDLQFHLLHINPGACGREGWHKVKTIVRFEVESGRISNLAVIELGSRGS